MEYEGVWLLVWLGAVMVLGLIFYLAEPFLGLRWVH
jgi:hypothetical protein